MSVDVSADERHAGLQRLLREAGYNIAFREGAWVECLLRFENERWVGRGPTRAGALADCVRRMLPSHLVSSRLEARLQEREATAVVVPVAPAARVAQAAVGASTAPLRHLDAHQREHAGRARLAAVLQKLEELGVAVARDVPRIARLTPEWQRHEILTWVCRARVAEETLPHAGEVAASVGRVIRVLASIARQFWPGCVWALQVAVTPDRAIDSRSLLGPAPQTWADAVLTCEQIAERRRRADLAAGRDEEGWADRELLGTPPEEDAGELQKVVAALDGLIGPMSPEAPDDNLALDASLLVELTHLAQALRALRRSAPALEWGTAMGRLRRVAAAHGGRAEALREALAPETRPARSWRELARGSAPELARTRDALQAELAASRVLPERAVAVATRAFDVLSTPEIAAVLGEDPAVAAALLASAEQQQDRRVRRRLRDLAERIAGGRRTAHGGPGAVGSSRPGIAGASTEDAHVATLVSRVRTVTHGRRALFVSNRDDDALEAKLQEQLGLSITWCDGSLRRMQAQCARIGQGSYDLVLGATGFQKHSTDGALARAAAAAGVPYVRVNRGRSLTVVQAIARAYGLVTVGDEAAQ